MLILGHRGASVAALENTPEAFRLADEMGADGVELDVRRVGDGRLLVAHDPLPDLLDEVDRLNLATLDDVLDACGDRMLVNVEIKNWPADAGFDPTMAMVAPIVEQLRRRGPAAVPRWLISSFSWDTLEACRAVAPEIATAWLVSTVSADRIAGIAAAGHTAVNPWEPKVTEEFVAHCHDAGLAVNTWTSNDPIRLVELADLGVDGVCTDVPDVALAALGRAGDPAAVNPSWAQWPVEEWPSTAP
ncbi:MAG TPA: glycerophosphodiester phosphodiesterase [Ilumatobacteraceae bacterium]|nr:glycerophosphodiester phosphodiesterase [Ilumatobacteraceae bacterium]